MFSRGNIASPRLHPGYPMDQIKEASKGKKMLGQKDGQEHGRWL
jgi:hypothetical protein